MSTGIIVPAVPNLPLPQDQFSKLYLAQLTNVLRLYFNQLNNSVLEINNLLGDLETGGGGSVINLPYGAFSSNAIQTTTANTATLMTLNTTDFSNQVSISSSKITASIAGIYNLQFSAQLQSTDNAPQDVFIWLRQNGTDIAGSTGVVGLPARKTPADPFHDIKGWNYFVSLNAGDYIEIYWSTTNANVSIHFYAASGSPTKPSTQSVVATLTFVSSL
jgi:hypothetical protein